MSKAHTHNPSGLLISAILSGVWRSELSSLNLSSEELSRIAPLLLVSGAGGLGWWRVRQTSLRTSASANELHQAYRLQSLCTAYYELEITEHVELLRAADIEPILIKGWSNSRLYPQTNLRPYGDIDLCVAPHSYQAAKALLHEHKGAGGLADLHAGFATIDRREFDDLYGRSQLVDLNGTKVRVLGSEDHLRVLCLHLLRHGAWRPLWLCDVAVALENLDCEFDWERCLGDDRREAHLVACVIGLAHQLLNAKLDAVPLAVRTKRLPRWLAPSVLKSWNNPSTDFHEPQRLAHTYLRDPRGLLEGMRLRWRTPVRASMDVRASFNNIPRLPIQVLDYFVCAIDFTARLPFMMRTGKLKRTT